MRQWIALVALLLPLAAGVALTEIGARMMFGVGLFGFVGQLYQRGIGDAWVAVGGMWFLAACGLLGAGAMLSIVCSNTALIGSRVVPHIFLGADLLGRDRYVPEDDPEAAPVAVGAPSTDAAHPTYGFDIIYIRHLLVANAVGSEQWQRLLALTTRNLMWPALGAPLVFAVAQIFAWAPLVVGREQGLDMAPELATAGAALPLPIVLAGELGLWVAPAILLILIVLMPLALRTGRWTREAYRQFEQPWDGPYPRGRPLPEAVRPGATLDGRIVDSARRAIGEKRTAQDALFLVEFDEPFRPPVRIGFRFRINRKRRAFIDYLEERKESGLPVRFEVAEAPGLNIVPRDAAGAPPPDGIGRDILNW